MLLHYLCKNPHKITKILYIVIKKKLLHPSNFDLVQVEYNFSSIIHVSNIPIIFDALNFSLPSLSLSSALDRLCHTSLTHDSSRSAPLTTMLASSDVAFVAVASLIALPLAGCGCFRCSANARLVENVRVQSSHLCGRCLL